MSGVSAYRVRHFVAESRHVSSFASPVRFISCHSRPQSRIRARDAAGNEGNTGSASCDNGVLVVAAGAGGFSGAAWFCGSVRVLEARAAPAPRGDVDWACSCSTESDGRGAGVGAFFCAAGAAAHAAAQLSNAISIKAIVRAALV